MRGVDAVSDATEVVENGTRGDRGHEELEDEAVGRVQTSLVATPPVAALESSEPQPAPGG